MLRGEFLLLVGGFLLGVKRKPRIGSSYGSAIYGVSPYGAPARRTNGR